MNLYFKAVGFSQYDSQIEESFIKTGIQESLNRGLVVHHAALNRGVIIIRLSKSIGLYLYGRYDGETFKYEYFFPFVVGHRETSNDELVIERHVDKESYAVVCDEQRTGVTLIFFLQNVMDYLEYLYSGRDFPKAEFNPDVRNDISKQPILNKTVRLSALSLAGTILLPIHKRSDKRERVRADEDKRSRLIQAAKNGDEDAMESLTIEDIDRYNEISMRIGKEDVFSIVDSTFMPCGVECDQYSVVGEILELTEEENIYTHEKLYIMVLECNNMIITTGISKEYLTGEPAVGRRFKGQIWLQGNVGF